MRNRRFTRAELQALNRALAFCLAAEEVFVDDDGLEDDPEMLRAAVSAHEKIGARLDVHQDRP